MRIGYIDALKGFASLCVVMGHALEKYLVYNVYGAVNPIIFGFYNAIYTFHMPLFMMLNGYIYCEAYPIDRNPEKKSKLYRQVGNLAALYAINSLTFGLFKLLFHSSGVVSGAVTLEDVLMIWVRPLRGFWCWYFYVLVIFYCLFSWKPLRQIDKRYMLCILLALSILSGYTAVKAFELSRVMFFAVFFYMGMVIHERPERFAWKSDKSIFVTSLISIVLCVIFWYGGPVTEEMMEHVMIRYLPAVGTIVGLCLSLSLWEIFRNIRLFSENRFLQTMGNYTLEIYLIHYTFLTGFKIVLQRIGMTNALLGTVISFTVSAAAPVLFALFTKKLKIHDLLFRPVTYFTARRAQKGHA